ncbi:hypothetical protein GCM10025771_18870 [Niveibacterium umoris]|uniref:Uncharacterized protein n=1 Tax=Niveibacterium umoris TaxID=1193620 RepID=A0A840BKH7_9RHOO|nr:hypothetical protein [Niveibacterium umoris]MBB4012924.1 hypothetical protein [Niveibacterium umoris]
MSNQENTSRPDTPDASAENTTQGVSESRRRLLVRGGMAAGPVILTLTSGPVLGGLNPGECISPSQTLSGALSHRGTKVGKCNGRSPGYWKTCSASNWPIPQTTPFHSIFAVGTLEGTRFFNGDGSMMTMIQVLTVLGYVDPYRVAFHCIGAYLNILKGGMIDPIALTAEALIAMWREYALTGKYTPYAGATPWDGPQIVNYLTSNYIAP